MRRFFAGSAAALLFLASYALAQLGRHSQIGRAEAEKITSGLMIGVNGADVRRFLADRGLTPLGSFAFTNGNTLHYAAQFRLTDGSLLLDLEATTGHAKPESNWTNRVLRAALLLSAGGQSSIQLRTNAP
jgi:hypothetical protein